MSQFCHSAEPSRIRPVTVGEPELAGRLAIITLMTRDASGDLTDRYSERKEGAAMLEARLNLRAI